MIPSAGCVIITDENVFRIYGDCFPDLPVLRIEPGEDSKKIETIERLARGLLNAGIDRSGFILAVGGGLVCDVAGFLASVYMRGIRCGFVSSTLLSQVDASAGGKNGVNIGSLKNVLGVIRQPEFVICDTAMLLTLPDDEFLSGLAELIKTAVIGDRELFGIIESNRGKILARNTELLTLLVARSIRFKSWVVSEDEMETGLRRVLNFGHTYGHAIELHQHLKHGFAVASGMELAARFSQERGYLTAGEADRIIALLDDFGLLSEYDLDEETLEKLIVHDKKKSGQQIYFIFAEGIGQAVAAKTPVEEISGFYRQYRKTKTTK